MMSHDARQRGLHVEELLVSLKRAWPALINSEGVSRSASSKLFARFVTFCVEEYSVPSRSVGTSHHPGE
jgi:hypothetical protein